MEMFGVRFRVPIMEPSRNRMSRQDGDTDGDDRGDGSLPAEWRDIWKIVETECVWSVETYIFCLQRGLTEVSPDIHPPFKGVTTRHYWRYVAKRDGVKFCKPNLPRCS